MCFLMVHGVLGADFLSSFLIFFFRKVEIRSKNQGKRLLGSVEGRSLPY